MACNYLSGKTNQFHFGLQFSLMIQTNFIILDHHCPHSILSSFRFSMHLSFCFLFCLSVQYAFHVAFKFGTVFLLFYGQWKYFWVSFMWANWVWYHYHSLQILFHVQWHCSIWSLQNLTQDTTTVLFGACSQICSNLFARNMVIP